MTVPAPASRATGVLLPVLCLLLASVCQWLVAPLGGELATLGMGAPVPVAWEAVQQTGLLAPTGDGGMDSPRLRPWLRATTDHGWRLLSVVEVFAIDRQERLLRWGRLQLEGG